MSKTHLGFKVIGTINSVQGECRAGHKVGDTFELGVIETAGLCGAFYHDIFPDIAVLQSGGQFPWNERDVVEVECPDRYNLVKLELGRIREPDGQQLD